MAAAGEGHVLFVWEDRPPAVWETHYDGACVKVCDGKATQNGAGFSWSANYADWRSRFGDGRIGVWTVAYPQDGTELGAVLAAHCPHAPYVVLDVEDFGGAVWSDTQLRTLVAGVRSHLPGTRVAYSTYPTAAQAREHHVDQPLLDGICDFAVPQVYYPYQRAELGKVFTQHKRAHVAVAPDDDADWAVSAKASLKESGSVFYWRSGLHGFDVWPLKTQVVPAPPVSVPSADDPLKPAVHEGGYPPRFVAWTGAKWFYTDLIFRRELTAPMAGGLHGGGVPVILWPHCEAETQAVHPV